MTGLNRLGFEERYRAIHAKDARFDGQFITAVRSTGIYCRPSCPARTPKRENVTFYATSAAAHDAGYRACKRCLPEAVPGTPAWNLGSDVTSRAMRLIADGTVEREGVSGLAQRLGYSSRHLTRLLTAELGAGPLALARAHRAQTARALLTATVLPFSDIAFAAGFSSIRQFNDTIRDVFQLTPGEIRTRGRDITAEHTAPGTISLTLPYRPPFDSAGVFTWLATRAIPGVEIAEADRYTRTLALPSGPARFTVAHDGEADSPFRLTADLSALRDLPSLVARVRRLFDLDADPVAVDESLASHPEHPALAAQIATVRGIRMPGAVDATEMVFRAIIGQQITVAAARTQLARLASAAGTPLPGPEHTSHVANLLFPTSAQIVEHHGEGLTGPKARTETVLRVAEAFADGTLTVSHGDDAAQQREALTSIKGIGDWTAGYVRMRVLGDPDVLLTGDVALRAGARAVGLPDSPRDLIGATEAFAPWRSYLALHLWRAAAVTGQRASAHRQGRATRTTLQTQPRHQQSPLQRHPESMLTKGPAA